MNRYTIVTEVERNLAREMLASPLVRARIMTNGVIDGAKVRAEVRRMRETLSEQSRNGAKKNGEKRGTKAFSRHSEPTPSPWAREHPKWDPK